MQILAIESAAKAAGAAVLCDGRLICEQFVNNGLTHSRTLMELIDGVLRAAGKKVTDMDGIAVDVGPGSFTGIRIGLGTAKGLALGADKPIAAVPSLLGMAWLMAGYPGTIVPIMDARRGEVYGAAYAFENGVPKEILPMEPQPLSALLEKIDTAVFIGDGAEVHREAIIEKMGNRADFAPPHLLHQHAAGVGLAARHIEWQSAHDAAPIYLRLAQAEREWLKKGEQG